LDLLIKLKAIGTNYSVSSLSKCPYSLPQTIATATTAIAITLLNKQQAWTHLTNSKATKAVEMEMEVVMETTTVTATTLLSISFTRNVDPETMASVATFFIYSLASFLAFCSFSMVGDIQYQHLISWTYSGSSFVVCNISEFSRDVLPKHFKHSNFSSFVRQLNM
jgi:hypothetical protein